MLYRMGRSWDPLQAAELLSGWSARSSSGLWVILTFCFDPQGCPDQSKQGGIEHDRPITVQRHVHGDEALEGEGRQRW